MAASPLLYSCLVLVLSTQATIDGMSDETGDSMELAAELRCVACHPSDAEGTGLRPAPDLIQVVSARRISWLEAFLADPHGTLPGTTMPNATHSLEAESQADLLHFLISRTEPREADPTTVETEQLEMGRDLYHGLGCVACHQPQEAAWELELPYFWTPEELAVDESSVVESETPVPEPTDVPLRQLEARFTLVGLAHFLAEPLGHLPAGRMPDLQLTDEEAWAIAVYLLRGAALGDTRTPSLVPGLSFALYEDLHVSELPDFSTLQPTTTGQLSGVGLPAEHPTDNFGLVISGTLTVPESGSWSFFLSSDDGSALELDGVRVIDNDGYHAALEVAATLNMQAGEHALRLEYFEASGEEVLQLEWSGPGQPRSPMPAAALRHKVLQFPAEPDLALEPARAERGAASYKLLACTTCHETGAAPLASPLHHAAKWSSACTSPNAGSGQPHYATDERDAETLREHDWAMAYAPSVTDRLQAARCLTCHSRGDLGGVPPARTEYFQSAYEVDLGDEGRLPPRLDHVGAKLRQSWLGRVLAEGSQGTGVRPYLRTRMPVFGEEDRTPLVQALVEADPKFQGLPLGQGPSPLGQQLVGTKNGLGCIQCHDFAGYDSLGIPAPDLAQVHERIESGWFRQLLLDPVSLNMNSRMPEFLVDGRSPVTDVFDGDPERQIQAIWSYLGLGARAPLPYGLDNPEATYEVQPEQRTKLVSVFMKDVSPRTVLVGNPNGIHYAFDQEANRLVAAWNGRFFNAVGTWHGRAGGLEEIPSEVRLEFLPGPALAHLASAADPWPEHVATQRLGTRLDESGRPTFRYRLGSIVVEESLTPKGSGSFTEFHRVLTFASPVEPRPLYFRTVYCETWPFGRPELVKYNKLMQDRTPSFGDPWHTWHPLFDAQQAFDGETTAVGPLNGVPPEYPPTHVYRIEFRRADDGLWRGAIALPYSLAFLR